MMVKVGNGLNHEVLLDFEVIYTDSLIHLFIATTRFKYLCIESTLGYDRQGKGIYKYGNQRSRKIINVHSPNTLIHNRLIVHTFVIRLTK